ncbi:MAG TPA: MFS transporter [Pseudomonadales bacterium]|nr:MFS transporter [Pseudomonadales bacterium]
MSDRPVEARHYVFLGFLTLLNVMNFVDRQLLASFANFVVPDLQLTNAEFGLLTGLAFIVFYVVMGLFMGVLADIVNRPRLVAVGLALWSALTAISGAARGFWSLALPRMFIGVGESILTPTSMSMLADRFSSSRLGFAAGFYYMGVPIGTGVSLLIVGYLGPELGWRNCFYLLGAIGLVLAVVMATLRETPRRHVLADAARTKPNISKIVATSWRALRESPALRYTIAGGVAWHFILGAAAYEQLWFVHERGFDRAEIARLTGWIGMAGGILGNLFGGLGSDALQKHTGMGRATFLCVVMLLLAPIGVVYRLVSPDSPWFWIGVFAGYFQVGCFYGPTFSAVQELVPPQIRATVVAFYILTLNLVGLGIGITAGGFLIDYLVAQSVAMPYTWALLTFTCLSMLCIPCFYVAGRRFQMDRERLYLAAEPT